MSINVRNTSTLVNTFALKEAQWFSCLTQSIIVLAACFLLSACNSSGSGGGDEQAVSDDDVTVAGRQVAIDMASVQAVVPPAASRESCIESEVMEERFLELVNEARSIARLCGDVQFAAAAPVAWSKAIENSALIHSIDMADNNFFAHIGSDGSHVGQRLTRQNYDWQLAVENVAAGASTPEQTVELWVDSAGHCENLMNPDVSEMAVSCADKEGSDFLRYWTQVLTTPAR